MKAEGAGLLELTTQSVTKGGNYIEAYGQDFGEEFGKIRVIEILGGGPVWDQNKVTFNNLTKGKSMRLSLIHKWFMILNYRKNKGGKNFITISRPVLQRMIDGKTRGLLIYRSAWCN